MFAMKLFEKRRRGRPRAFDEDAALAAAAAVFWRKGYAGATLEDLTSAMGINPPSLYGAFGDKEGLFTRAVDHYSVTVTASIRAELAAGDVWEALENFYLKAAESFGSPGCPTGCLMVSGLGGAIDDVPSARHKLAEAIDAMSAAVERRLRRAALDRQLPKEFPCADRATLAADFILAIAVRTRAGVTAARLSSEARNYARVILSTS